MPGTRQRLALAAAALVAALVCARPAAAQPVTVPSPGIEPDEPPGFHRPPFVLGFDVGLSALRVDRDTDEEGHGIGGALRAGYLVNQHVALLFELSFSRTRDDDSDSGSSAVLTVPSIGAQGWLTPRLWIRGAIGHGTIVRDERTVAEGTAFVGTAGYELVREQTFSIDLQVRIGAMYDDDGTSSRSSAVLIGVTSYGLGGLGVWIGR